MGGSTKDLSTDGRVALALADGSGACADVVATLGDADLEGGGADPYFEGGGSAPGPQSPHQTTTTTRR